MAQVLLELNGYVVTDSGDVGIGWERLIEHVRKGGTMAGIKALPDCDIDRYNSRRGTAHQIPVMTLNDTVTGPPISAYGWNLPEEARDLDLDYELAHRLSQKIPNPPDVYVERLAEELHMMRDRNMEDFLRALIYMFDWFGKLGDIVHGVGRGSSCASLVLYLIGVHMVDPIEYDIPITEFLR